MSGPTVTVAIVAYDSGDWLQGCVDGMARQTFADFEAVICDNASRDGSVERLRLPDRRFRIEAMGANLGFAAANNRAAFASSARWLATLNPDAVPDADWLEQLLAGSARWPDAASLGSTQLSLDDPGRLDGVGDVWHAAGVAWRARHGRPAAMIPPEGETFSACAAAALYRLADFKTLGGFDESFFCYLEDVDLGFRLRLAGAKVVQIPAAVVRHAGSAISGKDSEFTLFHGHRNRIWTFAQCTPGWLLPVLTPYHLAMNLGLLLLHGRTGSAGPLMRAYAAAWRGLPAVLRRRRAVQALRTASAADLAQAMAWDPLAVLRRDVLGGRLPFTRRALRRIEDELAAA